MFEIEIFEMSDIWYRGMYLFFSPVENKNFQKEQAVRTENTERYGLALGA